MKIYKEKTEYTPQIDSESVSDEYRTHAFEIAKALSSLNFMKERIEFLHEVTMDNGDVAMDLERAITALGIALASCTTYSQEYHEEAIETEA